MTGLDTILASCALAGAGSTAILGLRLRNRAKVIARLTDHVDQLIALTGRMVDTVADARRERRDLRKAHTRNTRLEEQHTALIEQNAYLTEENTRLNELSDIAVQDLLRETS
jgi:hypothetical protein